MASEDAIAALDVVRSDGASGIAIADANENAGPSEASAEATSTVRQSSAAGVSARKRRWGGR